MLSRVHAHNSSARSVEAVQRDCACGWLQWPMARGDAELRLFCFHLRGLGLRCIASGVLAFHQAWRWPQFNCLVAPIVLQSRLLRIFLYSLTH